MRVYLAVAAFFGSASVAAADFASCASIADPARRLACYDAASGRPAPPPPPRPDPVKTFGRNPAPPETTEATFGRPPPPPEAPKELGEISSTIQRTTLNGEGRIVLILANDQEWVLQDYDRPFPPRAQTPVTIERSLIGLSYLADLPSGAYLVARRR